MNESKPILLDSSRYLAHSFIVKDNGVMGSVQLNSLGLETFPHTAGRVGREQVPPGAPLTLSDPQRPHR